MVSQAVTIQGLSGGYEIQSLNGGLMVFQILEEECAGQSQNEHRLSTISLFAEVCL